MSSLSLEQVKRAVPKGLRVVVTQDIVDNLNGISDPLIAEQIKNNFISYGHVLSDGKFSIEMYLNAVKYVSFKLMGLTNEESYARTFTKRYQTLLSRGTSSKDIAAYVASYNKGKLVNLIMEQAMVPTWVLNQDMFQKAINVQAELMLNDKVSPKVRSDAANSLLTHLKRPEAAAPAINIDMRETSVVEDLKNTLSSLAQQQLGMIQGGMTAKTIAEQRIYEAEDVEATEVIDADPNEE